MSTRDAVAARIPLDIRHRLAQWRVEARVPTARWRPLPDVLIIGAQRSGTSTLYRHLHRHPDVAKPARKEVEYFSRRFGRGPSWYRAHFALELGRRHRLAFEATPDYLFHPAAAARAVGVVPDARIVVMLRDPVVRAWSHYDHMVALGHEQLGFEAALDAEADRCRPDVVRLAEDPTHDPVALLRFSYQARGRYADQLVPWIERFGRDRLLVVRSEDFFVDPGATFRRVTDHAGISPWTPDTFVNVSRTTRPGPGPVPEAARTRLASTFATSNAALVDLLGEAAPRWD